MIRSAQPSREFVAYAVQRFPALRTTFIRREVEALRILGVPIEVVSMRNVEERELAGDEQALQHVAETRYLPNHPLHSRSIYANIARILADPFKSGANWRLIASDPGGPGISRRMRLCIQVWRAAVMAQQLRRLGRCVHVHANFADGAATTALACARLLNVPFSFTSHTSFDSPALKEKLRAANFVASISQFDRERLIAIGGQEVAGKIHVVHCGLPLEEFYFRPFREPGDAFKILSVGALIAKKGHDNLIRACRWLRDRGLKFRCEIIGGGPLEKQLVELIEELELHDCVALTGPLPQASVKDKMRSADVFVLACKKTPEGDTDGIPVSLMEAMAIGVPVVSTAIAGIPELIQDGETGFLAASNSPETLASAIERALEADAQIKHQARKYIEAEFNQIREAKKLAGLLSAALLA